MKKRDRSDSSHAFLDVESRTRKADKIIRVLRQRTDLKNARILDIGTGSGHMPEYFARYAKEVVSVDVVDERRIKKGFTFKLVKDEHLPFKESSFDIVISNHVIEHVQNQQLHIDEVFRVLKDGGFVYFATPNRYWITDPHYRIPFINWMPRKAAGMYLKTTRGKTWDIKPITVNYLKKHINDTCRIDPIVADIMKRPDSYNFDMLRKLQPIMKRTPYPVLRSMSALSPTILLMMTKKDASSS